MTIVVFTAELDVSYAEWKSRFDKHQPVREVAGLVDVFVGKDIEKESFVAIMQIPSVEALDEFVKATNATILNGSLYG